MVDKDNAYPPNHVTDEEIYMAAVLQNLGSEQNETIQLFFASNYYIETIVAAYSGCLHLYDVHGISLLLSGHIEREDILYNSTLLPIQEWIVDPHIFLHPGSYFGQITWYLILLSDFNSSYVQDSLKTLNLRYFIMEKNENMAFDWWGYLGDPYFYSEFMATIDAPIITETEHLILYEL